MNCIENANGVVANNLKRIIEEKGLKQGKVAEKTGLTNQKLSNVLNGRRLLKASEICALMEVLDVDANDLFQFEKEKELIK